MEQATTEQLAVRLDSDLTLCPRSARLGHRIKSLSREMLEALCHEYGCSMVGDARADYGLTASVEDGWIWVMSWLLADRTGQITLIRQPVGCGD